MFRMFNEKHDKTPQTALPFCGVCCILGVVICMEKYSIQHNKTIRFPMFYLSRFYEKQTISLGNYIISQYKKIYVILLKELQMYLKLKLMMMLQLKYQKWTRM